MARRVTSSEPFLRFCSSVRFSTLRKANYPGAKTSYPSFFVSIRFFRDPKTSQDCLSASGKEGSGIPRERANFRVKEAEIAIVLGTERASDCRLNGSD